MAKVRFFWNDPLDPDQVRLSWCAAFNRSIDTDTWSKVWNWRYQGNPLSEIPMAAYIIDNGMLACFYAVSPVYLITPQGSVIHSGLMNMGFTHPEHQGKGFFQILNTELNNNLHSRGFNAIFGFANHNSHYAYRKYLRWTDIALLTNFELDASHLRYLKTADRAYQVSIVSIDDDLITRLESYCVAEGKYYVARNREYLSWRIKNNPEHNYNGIGIHKGDGLVCCAIYKRYGDYEADIMEVFYQSVTGNHCDMLFMMSEYLVQLGFRKINIWSNLHSQEHLELEKVGYRETFANTHFGVIDFADNKGITDLRLWHYRFMDSDVY